MGVVSPFARVAVLAGQPGEANYKSNASDATVVLFCTACSRRVGGSCACKHPTTQMAVIPTETAKFRYVTMIILSFNSASLRAWGITDIIIACAQVFCDPLRVVTFAVAQVN